MKLMDIIPWVCYAAPSSPPVQRHQQRHIWNKQEMVILGGLFVGVTYVCIKFSPPLELPDDRLNPIQDRVRSPVVLRGLDGHRVKDNAGHHLGILAFSPNYYYLPPPPHFSWIVSIWTSPWIRWSRPGWRCRSRRWASRGRSSWSTAERRAPAQDHAEEEEGEMRRMIKRIAPWKLRWSNKQHIVHTSDEDERE